MKARSRSPVSSASPRQIRFDSMTMGELRGVPSLLPHPSPVPARLLPGGPPLLADRDPDAALREEPGGRDPHHPGADHEHIHRLGERIGERDRGRLRDHRHVGSPRVPEWSSGAHRRSGRSGIGRAPKDRAHLLSCPRNSFDILDDPRFSGTRPSSPLSGNRRCGGAVTAGGRLYPRPRSAQGGGTARTPPVSSRGACEGLRRPASGRLRPPIGWIMAGTENRPKRGDPA